MADAVTVTQRSPLQLSARRRPSWLADLDASAAPPRRAASNLTPPRPPRSARRHESAAAPAEKVALAPLLPPALTPPPPSPPAPPLMKALARTPLLAPLRNDTPDDCDPTGRRNAVAPDAATVNADMINSPGAARALLAGCSVARWASGSVAVMLPSRNWIAPGCVVTGASHTSVLRLSSIFPIPPPLPLHTPQPPLPARPRLPHWHHPQRQRQRQQEQPPHVLQPPPVFTIAKHRRAARVAIILVGRAG